METAFRAAATARPPLPPSTFPSAHRASSSSTSSFSKHASRAQFRPTSLSLPTSTTLSLFAFFTAPNEAMAFSFSKEQIMSSLTQVENTVDQVQVLGSEVLDFSQRVLQVVIETVKPSVDLALPILQKAGDQALKVASPAISEASKKSQEAIQSSGFDTEPVVGAAKTVAGVAQQTTKVIEGAKPIASSTVDTILSTDPVTLATTAGALFLVYLLLPPVWSVISFGLRGYKGELTPAQTLDLLSTRNHLLIDIRSEKDKNKAGVPRLPSSVKNKMISVPLEELPTKLKGLVRSVKKLEAEIVALKISFLKRINKGSNIVIMGSYSDTEKTVAKALTSFGFKNCWIMADGFSGNKGWLSSQLGADSYNLSLPEVVSPSRVIPAAVRRFGTTSSTALQSSPKFLPGSKQ
ncbi:calcium sensing receptor, chloroplastic [Macadamia integrifolia]|uniref:calcium sensing receptor, chloroplastic n=1 Tax=Macadamia integrifolia TaxID=60698 RepID=UPI001C501C9C|nr:calcium sensing receptor, chloroplastic [Macadamia integrifolia]